MSVLTKKIRIQTKGYSDIIDITDQIEEALNHSNLKDGIVTVFIPGATAGITTIEYEDGAVTDFKKLWDKIIPVNSQYEHNLRWGDGNGFSHIRASLLGPSITIPFQNSKLLRGTWQQVIVVDFDNRSRSREIIFQIMGE